MRYAWLVLFMLAACGGDDDGGGDGDGDGDRGPISDGDLEGSCAGTDCDGPAPEGNCYCDDECAHFGDCCSDYVDVCQPGGATCGGFAGLTCDEAGTYCHYDLDERCGEGDQAGTCIAMPDSCIDVFAPVCGCDGQDYPNSCGAAMAGTSVASEGECGG
jgi:hypothetical protein